MNPVSFGGPESGIGAGCVRLAEGVWITSGRAAVLEGKDHLAVIDPGDEPCGRKEKPEGPLADVLRLICETGKPLRWVLLTHAHPDHVANLPRFRDAGPARVLAHAASTERPDVTVSERVSLDLGGGLEAIPTPGHSARGDDLTFWAAASGVVFTGDLVQPKGEEWGRTFYPSPYAYFTDGDLYCSSLERIAALPFTALVTGHREIRRGEAGRRWVELTLLSLRRVAEAVSAWNGPEDLRVAGPAIYRSLARERGIPDDAIEARLASFPAGRSAFENYDLPGIAYYWTRLRGARSG